MIIFLLLIGLFGQCTDSDGCAVDRATAWCEMTDTIYYRSVDCNPGYTQKPLRCDIVVFFRGPFVQIEPPVVPGGFARWGERRSPGEHDVGDTDVLVWKEGKPSIGGKAATGQLNPRGKCVEGLQTTMTAGNVTGSRFGLLVGKWCSTAGRTSWWRESSVMGEQASVDVADWKQQPASCTWQHILVMQTVVTHTYFNDFIWLLTHLFMSGQLID